MLDWKVWFSHKPSFVTDKSRCELVIMLIMYLSNICTVLTYGDVLTVQLAMQYNFMIRTIYLTKVNDY